jgi:hypothetical protein
MSCGNLVHTAFIIDIGAILAMERELRRRACGAALFVLAYLICPTRYVYSLTTLFSVS